jgi:hypothetical protein
MSIISYLTVTLDPILLDEELHLCHELAGVSELWEHVEAMDDVRVLDHPHRLELLALHVHVPRMLVLDQVEPADHHHHCREHLGELDTGSFLTTVRVKPAASGNGLPEGFEQLSKKPLKFKFPNQTPSPTGFWRFIERFER